MKDFRKKAVVNLYDFVMQAIDEYDSHMKYDGKSLDEYDDSDWMTLVDSYIKEKLIESMKEELDNSFPTPIYQKHLLTYGARLLEIIHDNWEHTPEGKEEKMRWDFVYEHLIGELEKLNGGKIKLWVNVYQRERCFGGHEEGGWYYDRDKCIASHEVIYESADRIAEKCEKEHGKGEGDISSVLGGYEIHVRIEDLHAETEDTERPYYC